MWDKRDEDNGLRELAAKIAASKASGLEVDEVIPDEIDYELADEFAGLIDKEYDV
jgi:hypothetical protein